MSHLAKCSTLLLFLENSTSFIKYLSELSMLSIYLVPKAPYVMKNTSCALEICFIAYPCNSMNSSAKFLCRSGNCSMFLQGRKSKECSISLLTTIRSPV